MVERKAGASHPSSTTEAPETASPRPDERTRGSRRKPLTEPEAMSRKQLQNPQTYVGLEKRIPLDWSEHLTPEKVCMRRREDGSFGPTGLYGARIPRSDVLDLLRSAIKPNRIYRIEDVLAKRTSRVTVILENLVDAANASACTRTCEALGLSSMSVIDSYEPFRTTQGITMNADKWLDIRKYNHYMDAVEKVKADGYSIVATCLDADAVAIEEVDFQSLGKVCIVVGNEQRGVSFGLKEKADVKVYVPMLGMTQSLNVATTCGIFLHYLRTLGMFKPDLSDDTLVELYTKWLLVSAKNGPLLLEKNGYGREIPGYL